MKQYRVEMKIKTKSGNHQEIVDTFSGSSEDAVRYLSKKYVSPGWLERFEKKLLEEVEEWNVILAERNNR